MWLFEVMQAEKLIHLIPWTNLTHGLEAKNKNVTILSVDFISKLIIRVAEQSLLFNLKQKITTFVL